MRASINPADRELARDLAKKEEKQKAPTQHQLDELYGEIYEFMVAKKAEAEKQGKPCLFIMGETHLTPLGKSPLVVQTMMLNIGLKLGIKTLYLESDPASLEQRKQLAALAPKIKQKSAAEYQKFENDMAPTVHLLRQPSFQKALTIHATIPDGVSNSNQYSSHASKYIRQKQTSGIFVTGLKHLQELSQDKQLNAAYAVSIVAAPIAEQIRAIGSSKNDPTIEFALTDPKVQRFPVPGKLIDTRVDDLLKMVDQAKNNFQPQKQTKVAKEESKPSLSSRASESVRPVQAERIVHQKPMSIGEILSGSTFSAIRPSTVSNARAAAIPSFSVRSSVSQNPTATTSSTGLAMLGFWAGAKLGLCPSLSPSDLPITFSHPELAAAAQEQAREASAKKLLVRKGTSLEAVLMHTFDKEYTQGTSEKREQMQAFIIDVALGDVTSTIGKAFNQYSQIGDEQLRSAQFLDLMEQHAEPAAQLKYGMG